MTYTVKMANGMWSKRRICIITTDIAGPIKNGGIGTAYEALAELFASAGNDVRILYVNDSHSTEEIYPWIESYKLRNISMEVLRSDQQDYELAIPIGRKRSYLVMTWLLDRLHAFDVIYAPDWKGLLYYSLLARKQGLLDTDAIFCLGIHSPTKWSLDGGGVLPRSIDDLEEDFMEREACSLADQVISPSSYMLKWMDQQKWAISGRATVLRNCVSPRLLSSSCQTRADDGVACERIAFFGRLEDRKGLRTFLKAITRSQVSGRADLEVLFLGKEGQVDGLPASDVINQASADWECKVSTYTDLDWMGALRELSIPGTLAVIPSLIENSPYTVLECLSSGISFIASDVGGIPELIHPDDVSTVCFNLTPDKMSERLNKILSVGLPRARIRSDEEEVRLSWLTFNATIECAERPIFKIPAPRVSVCIIHYDRPELLSQAIRSIEQQTYDCIEVVLVDCGSRLPSSIEYVKSLEENFIGRGWKVVWDNDRYLGAARNTAARHASGDFLLFMDDDNIAKPTEIETFVRASAYSDADIFTCAKSDFSGDLLDETVEVRWVPLGGAVGPGLYTNVFGDANCFIKKSVLDITGGFSEIYGIGHEDWEFFAKACLSGIKLEVVPFSLFWYRTSATSMSTELKLRTSNHKRSISPYAGKLGNHLNLAVEFGLGQFLELLESRSRADSWHSSGLNSNVVLLSESEEVFVRNPTLHSHLEFLESHWQDLEARFEKGLDLRGGYFRAVIRIDCLNEVPLRFAFIEEHDRMGGAVARATAEYELWRTFKPGLQYINFGPEHMRAHKGKPTLSCVTAIYFGGAVSDAVVSCSLEHVGSGNTLSIRLVRG